MDPVQVANGFFHRWRSSRMLCFVYKKLRMFAPTNHENFHQKLWNATNFFFDVGHPNILLSILWYYTVVVGQHPTAVGMNKTCSLSTRIGQTFYEVLPISQSPIIASATSAFSSITPLQPKVLKPQQSPWSQTYQQKGGWQCWCTIHGPIWSAAAVVVVVSVVVCFMLVNA